MPRSIDDILNFREDISPFLVHLTRATPDLVARDRLEHIIDEHQLRTSGNAISDARFGTFTNNMTAQQICRFFGAICFTETPINEVHCMLEIAYRQINLEPYGLVFLKERLKPKGVGPVFYFNNELQDKDAVIAALCGLINDNPEAAERVLPMNQQFRPFHHAARSS